MFDNTIQVPADAGQTGAEAQPETVDTGAANPYYKEEAKKAFAERDAAKKALAELEKKLEQNAKAKLEEEGKFKEIAEAEKKRAEELEAKLLAQQESYVNSVKQSELKLLAKEAGIIDAEDIIRLTDMENIGYEDGKVVGASEAVAELKTKKPYLFGEAQAKTPPVGRPGISSQGVDTSRMTVEERAKLYYSQIKT